MKKFYSLLSIMFLAIFVIGFSNYSNAQVTKAPKIEISIPGNGCAPVMVTFMNMSHTAYDTTRIRYRWFADNNQTPFYIGYVPAAREFQKGFHNIRVEADSVGQFRGSSFKDFKLEAKPTEFLPNNNAQYCPGEEVVFRIQESIMNVEWDFGDGPTLDNRFNNYVRHTYKNPGTYLVKARYNHQCGFDSLKQNIVISQTAVPTVMIQTMGGNQVCINDEVAFETAEKYTEYTWNFGDGSTSNLPKPTHAYSAMKQYSVVLTVKNICGKIGKDSVYVNVTNNMPAYAQFNFWMEKNSCPNAPIHFNANGTGRYQWWFGDGGTSNLRSPINAYADTGQYKVKLVVTNGCGRSDTSYNMVKIFSDPNNMPPFPYIQVGLSNNSNNNNMNPSDTLKVCPGEKIVFQNQSWDDGASYKWELGDGTVYSVKNGEHIYKTPGKYLVKLTLTNNCWGSSFATKPLVVSNLIKPLVNLKAIPKEFCPGEKAFFFDDGNESENPRYTYFIDFGDGTKKDNIKGSTDTLYKTLATHAYANAGAYNFKFKANNTCGNADSIVGQFNVSNDASKIPFYYLDNSTTTRTEGMEDWSVRRMPFDSKFIIPVRWDNWPGIDTMLTAYFFWGQFDPANPNAAGEPAAMVKKRIKNIINDGVDTIVAYVPYDMTKADSVGLVIGWYCNHRNSDGMPNAMATAIKSAQPVKSIKVVPAGVVDVGGLYAPGIVFPPNAFNGTCIPNPKGSWQFKIAEGNFYLLRIHDSSYELNQSSSPTNYDKSMGISNGDIQIKHDTIIFHDPTCGTSGMYKFNVSGDKLYMGKLNDDCQKRSDAIASKFYTSFEDKYIQDRSGCPGDKVKFTVAGGITCQWNFGDGSPLVTGPVVYHAYADTGKFLAKAIATNACGRVDTLKTLVQIRKSALPQAYFDIDKHWAFKGDTVHFRYYGGDDDNMINTKFVWNFGDGSTSTLRTPTHVFKYTGGYDIKLTVTNGCGSNSETRHIEIGGQFDQCNLQAKFYIAKADSAKLRPNIPVKFENNTFGKYTKYSWNFSDGVADTARNPLHTFTKSGLYRVCLSVYDDSTKCSDQTCMEILVGELACNADFNFVINNTSNTVEFFDKSLKASKWLWNFQDGKTDTLANPKHMFAKPGVYDICLSIYDKVSGCQSQKCQVLSVGQIDTSRYCKAEYSYFVNQTTLEVTFKNESLGKIAKGNWNFGDGFYAYEENPVHKYTKPGLYKVCGSIMDSAGCQSVICKDIQVGMLNCNADFTYFIDPATNQVKFSPNDLGKNLIYFWNFGDGQTSNVYAASNTYKYPGRYNVIHAIKDTITGCKSDKALEIQIGQEYCTAAFSFMIDQQTKTVKFLAKADTGVIKQWKFGDGKIDSITNPVHQYANFGAYQVCLTVYNPKNKCTENSCITINLSNQVSTAVIDADFGFLADSKTQKVQYFDKSMGKIKRYYWNFGDGTSDTIANPTHIYAKPGLYKVCLFVADSAKNVSEECKEVNVNAVACKANFNYLTKSDGLSVQFLDMSSAQTTIKEHYWDFGNGQFSNKKDAFVTFAKPGTYKVCKSIADSLGCKAADCKEVQVGSSACTANFINFVDEVKKLVQFTDQSVSDSSTYFWDFGDGSFSNQKNPSHIYQKAGIYKICLTIKSVKTNCVANICKDIQVGTVLCEADFTYLVDALSRTIKLQNISKGDFKRFYWENGSGKSDTLENPTFVYTVDGNYNVCLQAFNPITNCKSRICKTIAVIKDTAKLVRFSSDFTYYMVIDSNKIVLTDKSSGNPDKWYWTFGDGTYDKVQNAIHTYTKPGTYKICHSTFKTSTGEFDELCREIIIGQEPCNLTGGFNLFIDAKKLTVYLSDNSIGNAQKWFWKFGDGVTSQGKVPQHTYAKPGYYVISQSVIDTIKHCTGYYADLVQVGDVNCKAAFDYSVDMSLNKLTLKNTSTGNVAKYFWNFGNFITSTEENPNYTYPDAGLYRVSLVTTSLDASCKDFFSQAIQVGTINCSADFDYYADSLTNTATFKNKALGTATRYLWLFGDGSTSSEANPTHKYKAPGYYKVGLNTYNPVNGCMDYFDKIILIGSEGVDCQAEFQYLVDDASKSVKFYDNSNGKSLKYSWNFGDKTQTETIAEPTHTYAAGGYYNVCLTVYAGNGVQNTICKLIKVAPDVANNCVADFDFNIDSVAKTANLSDKSVGGVDKWLWTFGDGTKSESQNPSHTYAAAGYYPVTLVVKNQTTGCTKATVKLINVSDAPGLKTVFAIGLDTTRIKGTGAYPIAFTGVTNDGGVKYVWNFGDGSKDSTTTSPSHVYTQSGTYNVCLTVSDPVTNQSNKYCQSIVASSLGVKTNMSSDIMLKAYPSPFSKNVTLEYSIPENGEYELIISDMYGRKISSIAKGNKVQGVYTELWNGSNLSNGTYFVQLYSKNVPLKTIVMVKAE